MPPRSPAVSLWVAHTLAHARAALAPHSHRTRTALAPHSHASSLSSCPALQRLTPHHTAPHAYALSPARHTLTTHADHLPFPSFTFTADGTANDAVDVALTMMGQGGGSTPPTVYVCTLQSAPCTSGRAVWEGPAGTVLTMRAPKLLAGPTNYSIAVYSTPGGDDTGVYGSTYSIVFTTAQGTTILADGRPQIGACTHGESEYFALTVPATAAAESDLWISVREEGERGKREREREREREGERREREKREREKRKREERERARAREREGEGVKREGKRKSERTCSV